MLSSRYLLPHLMNLKAFAPARKYFILIMAVLIIGLLIIKEWEVWTINRWSIAYISHSFSKESGGMLLDQSSKLHTRASVWLSREAIQAGDPALALDLLKPLLPSGKGIVLSVQGEALAAVGEFESAVGYWVQGGDYQSLMRAAEQNMVGGQLENAELAYEGAWQVDPVKGSEPLAMFMLNVLNDPEQAERLLFSTQLQFSNSEMYPLWWLRIGDALMAQQKWLEAYEAYTNVIEHDSSLNWQAYLGTAKALYESGMPFSKVLSEIHHAIRITSNKPQIYDLLGDLYFREKNYVAAQKSYSISASLVSDEMINNLKYLKWLNLKQGRALIKAGMVENAVEFLEAAILRFQNYDEIHFLLAQGYSSQGKFLEAINIMERGLQMAKDPHADRWAELGILYERTGDVCMARDAFDHALLQDPNHSVALEGLRRLGELCIPTK